MSGAPFDYRTYRGGMRFQLPKRVSLEAEDQYFDVGPARGHLLRVGGGAVLRDRLSVQAAYHKGPNAELRAEFVSMRADSRVGRLGVLGGLSLGVTRPVLLGQPAGATALDAREYFGGVRVPAGRQSFSVIVDALRSDTLRRQSVGFLWQRDF
jgi:hypothetical protein